MWSKLRGCCCQAQSGHSTDVCLRICRVFLDATGCRTIGTRWRIIKWSLKHHRTSETFPDKIYNSYWPTGSFERWGRKGVVFKYDLVFLLSRDIYIQFCYSKTTRRGKGDKSRIEPQHLWISVNKLLLVAFTSNVWWIVTRTVNRIKHKSRRTILETILKLCASIK